MGFDQLIQIASLGGFAFAAATFLLVLLALFNAWRKGELVSRSVHDAVVKLLTDENRALRQTNESLRNDLRDAGNEHRRLSALLIDRAK